MESGELLDNQTTLENCSIRYALNGTNLDPISVIERYSNCELKQTFMPKFVYTVRIFIFTWLICGIFGNSLSFIIWYSKQQRRKNSSAIYLAALSLTDLFLIILLLNYYLEQYWCVRNVTHILGICQIYQCLFIFTQYYSIVLVFGFTLERYLAVCFPFKRHKLCTTKRALLAIFLLSLFVLIPMICQIILWEYADGECRMKMSVVQNQNFQTLMFSQEVLFSFVVPMATFVFNVLVLSEMRRLIRSNVVPKSTNPNQSQSFLRVLSKQRQTNVCKRNSSIMENQSYSTTFTIQTQLKGSNTRNESAQFLSATLMLIILSFYLIACSVPTGIVYFLQFKWIQPDDCLSDEGIRQSKDWSEFLFQIKTKDIVDTICASHYACNFFIYIITCADFRKQVIKIFKFKFQRNRLISEFGTEHLLLARRTKPRSLRSTIIIDTNDNNNNTRTDDNNNKNNKNEYANYKYPNNLNSLNQQHR